MAFDKFLAERISQCLTEHKVSFYEKKMMGGITWMVDEKMCVGIFKGDLMVRIAPDEVEDLLKKEGTSQMTLGGKAMTGYLSISPEAIDLDEDLSFWVKKCLDYNPKAKSSKKK
jgi:TfoX/Sxy family transcriptional regulator of competence genes